MLPVRMKLQLFAFVLLSGGVAANLFLLQPGRGHTTARAPQSAGDSLFASIADPSIGDTGSIGRQSGIKVPPLGSSANISAGTLAAADIPQDIREVTRAVQRELRIRGYETGAADGVPSQMTQAAIMGFEFDHQLPLTGRPSQELLKSILLGGDSGTGKGTAQPSQSAEAEAVIRSVQTSLARLGYKPGRITGRLSSDTARAIREFEVDQALPESGRVSGPLVARLARLTDEGAVAGPAEGKLASGR
jgi:peptidoglycan hydrolase-like protein with peptidoglycan-binding domain